MRQPGQLALFAPPQALRRRGVRFDNLALVPASLLPHRHEYQELANTLPPGQVLIVVPRAPRLAFLTKVAEQLRRRGHQVTTLSADQIIHRSIDGPYVQGAQRPNRHLHAR